jgi:NADH-quinone oxidoreductase subunit F
VSNEIDVADIDRIVDETGRGAGAVIAVLQAIQTHFRHLPDEALRRVCETTEITPAAIEGVATFFAQFRRTPVGEHIISVCDGTACHVKGAPAVYDAIVRHLRIEQGEDTDAEGLFTLETIACLGCCTRAPAVRIDDSVYGHVRPNAVSHMLEDFLAREAAGESRGRERKREANLASGEIRIGLGSCCVAGGSEKIRQALEDALLDIDSDVHVKHVSCVGMCHQTPMLEVLLPEMPPKLYARVKPEDVYGIVTHHFAARTPLARVRTSATRWLERLYTDDGRGALAKYSIDVRDEPVEAFLSSQRRLATECCGEISPTDIEEYRRVGGFEALRKCMPITTGSGDSPGGELSPEAIIERVRRSGLRGRGGAGFLTGRKWEIVRAVPGDRKYIICNGDEGDPGAFMDRMILESYPYRVIEGMLIASLAVAAHEGVFYIRAEYPLAVRRIRAAIDICEREGLLGDDVLGSGHALHLRVMEGAGAFVCGEETALIASLEGRRGSPTYRPPYPAQQGLHGQPTLVNNAETFALVPWIVRHGADAFASLGTESSKGTKVFSLAGKINRGGLIEVPMGMTVRQIVEDVGGGVPDGEFKAVQVGGPSGGCIPASMGDTPVDYEALTEVGAMMGSGGFVVLDESDCMVEVTRYFLSFTQLESCGKCTPCRVGTRRMLETLDRLCKGEGKPGDVEQLQHLAEVVKEQSLCGLGSTAPNPVLTTIRYFRDEFEAHVEGRCPSRKCKALIKYVITDRCNGCTKCAQGCPVGAIEMRPYEQHEIDLELCVRCDNCRQVCPVDAVDVE